jgi:hypothetical protein
VIVLACYLSHEARRALPPEFAELFKDYDRPGTLSAPIHVRVTPEILAAFRQACPVPFAERTIIELPESAGKFNFRFAENV